MDEEVEFCDGEPAEEDWVTCDHRKVFEVGWCGALFVVDEHENFDERVRSEMKKRQWFPNVWFVSDHGNFCLLNVWPAPTGGKDGRQEGA